MTGNQLVELLLKLPDEAREHLVVYYGGDDWGGVYYQVNDVKLVEVPKSEVAGMTIKHKKEMIMVLEVS